MEGRVPELEKKVEKLEEAVRGLLSLAENQGEINDSSEKLFRMIEKWKNEQN